MKTLKKQEELILWNKIAKLRNQGLTAPQIANALGISHHTSRRLYNLSEDELLQRQNRQYGRTHLLAEYESYIISLLEIYPFFTSVQIQDRLKKDFPNAPQVCEKTVFNFIKHIRKKHNIPARR